jgi:hypothetical protein
MKISRDTLKAMLRDYGGFPLSDAELDLIQPELDNYLSEGLCCMNPEQAAVTLR